MHRTIHFILNTDLTGPGNLENVPNYLNIYLRRSELRFSRQLQGGGQTQARTPGSGRIELLVVPAV